MDKPAYEMTRDGFVFISIGFTGKKATELSLVYIDGFDEIVNMQRNTTRPGSFSENIDIKRANAMG